MSSFNLELPQANTRAGIRLVRSHLGLPQMANFTPLGEPRWKRDPSEPSSSQPSHAPTDFVDTLGKAIVRPAVTGACRKCGFTGHLPFQCRNFIQVKPNQPETIDVSSTSSENEYETPLTTKDKKATKKAKKLVKKQLKKLKKLEKQEKKKKRKRRHSSSSSPSSSDSDHERKKKRKKKESKKRKHKKRRSRSSSSSSESTDSD